MRDYRGNPLDRFPHPSAPTAPTTPTISADWRFLPGIPAGGAALVLAREEDGLAAALSASFDLVISLACPAELPPPGTFWPDGLRGQRARVCATLDRAPFPPASFDLVALPYGLPGAGADRGLHLAYLRAARRLTRPGGALYLGFAGRWSYRRLFRDPAPSRPGATPVQVSRLVRRAGYSSAAVYGAMPDHLAPDYLLPLRGEALAFALQHQLGRKLPAAVRPWLARPRVAGWFRWFLPAYGLVAQAAGSSA